MKRAISFLLMLMMHVFWAVSAFGVGFQKQTDSQYLIYNQKTKEAVEIYQEAKRAFSSMLYVDNILKAKVEPKSDVYDDLFAVADSMMAALEDGITNSAAVAITFLLSDTKSGQESGSMPATIISLYTAVYNDAIEQLQKIKKDLKDTLTSAFADSVLDDDEFAEMANIMDALDPLFELAYPSELRDKQ